MSRTLQLIYLLLLRAFVLSILLSSCSDNNPVSQNKEPMEQDTVIVPKDTLIKDTLKKDPPAPLPIILDFAPTRAYEGTRITIYGRNLSTDTAARAYIGNVRATITGGYHEQITIEVPYGAPSGKIKICNSAGCTESAKVFEMIPSWTYGSAAVEIKGLEVLMRLYLDAIIPDKGPRKIDSTYSRVYDTVFFLSNRGSLPPLTPGNCNRVSSADSIRLCYQDIGYDGKGPNRSNSLLVILDRTNHIVTSLELQARYSYSSGGHSGYLTGRSVRISGTNLPYIDEGPGLIRMSLASQQFTLSSDTTMSSGNSGPLSGPPYNWYLRAERIVSAQPDAYLRISLK